MNWLTIILISLGLILFELCLKPLINIYGAVPLLVVPFLVMLSIKYRGYIHYFLAIFFGIIFDSLSYESNWRFTFIFVAITILGRTLFFRESNYNVWQSYMILISISVFAIYLSQINVLINDNFVGWSNFAVISVLSIILTLIVGALLYRYLNGYVDWLNKKRSEDYKK